MAEPQGICICLDPSGSHPNPGCFLHGVKAQAERSATKTPNELAEAFLRGVKATKIVRLAMCERCGKNYGDDIETAWKELDLHHVKPRRSGRRFRGGLSWLRSVDHPNNLVLVCKPCHRIVQT